MSRNQASALLRAHEADLRASGIARLSILGSVARDAANDRSDVDLLAAFDDRHAISLLGMIGLQNRLSDLLGCPVDLIEEGTLRPRAKRAAEQDMVRAF